MLKLIKHHWIRFYGPPVRIHTDKDIRLKGDSGGYRNVFAAMGVETSFSQFYRPQSNGLCERMNDEYQEEVRIPRQSIKTSSWVQLNDYVVICMNHKQSGNSGYSRGDVFHGRPTLETTLESYNRLPLLIASMILFCLCLCLLLLLLDLAQAFQTYMFC